MTRVVPLVLGFLLVTSCPAVAQGEAQPPASGRPISLKGIRPADVLARVELLGQEIELIRVRLQLPAPTPLGLRVENAQPREVYFQALTLLRKADQLCFERVRTRGVAMTPVHAAKLAPFHVWQTVNRAFERIGAVRKELKLPETSREQIRPETTTPTDVFNSILELSRRLDQLLLTGFAPADVFQQVTWSVHHAARLLSVFHMVIRIPPEPAYEAGKLPADVHQRLLGCFDVLRQVTKRVGVSSLEIRTEKLNHTAVVPSDVYNVASMITAQLGILHSTLPLQPVVPAYAPGPKVPADVYQRAGVLEAQLRQLEASVRGNPAALRAPSDR